ncbi:MAG TPA: hypothetical protein VFI47_14385, partial [Acidimicrobiales bacterium]|nr:hypothetical protein [Acidimicrobiales bacterium]
ILCSAPCREPLHTRLLLEFVNGYRLAYDCPRRLGRISLAADVERFVAEQRLGPDASARTSTA